MYTHTYNKVLVAVVVVPRFSTRLTGSRAICAAAQRRVAKHVLGEHGVRVDDDARVVGAHARVQQ